MVNGKPTFNRDQDRKGQGDLENAEVVVVLELVQLVVYIVRVLTIRFGWLACLAPRDRC